MIFIDCSARVLWCHKIARLLCFCADYFRMVQPSYHPRSSPRTCVAFGRPTALEELQHLSNRSARWFFSSVTHPLLCCFCFARMPQRDAQICLTASTAAEYFRKTTSPVEAREACSPLFWREETELAKTARFLINHGTELSISSGKVALYKVKPSVRVGNRAVRYVTGSKAADFNVRKSEEITLEVLTFRS